VLQFSTVFHWAIVLSHSSCYNAQPFFIEQQCSTILVNSVILHATELSHFPLSYSAQPFSTTTVLTHFAKRLSEALARVAGGGLVVEALGQEAASGSVVGVRDRVTQTGHAGLCSGGRPWLSRSVGPLCPVHHPRWWIAVPSMYIFLWISSYRYIWLPHFIYFDNGDNIYKSYLLITKTTTNL
jgi:hypothetical protein